MESLLRNDVKNAIAFSRYCADVDTVVADVGDDWTMDSIYDSIKRNNTGPAKHNIACIFECRCASLTFSEKK